MCSCAEQFVALTKKVPHPGLLCCCFFANARVWVPMLLHYMKTLLCIFYAWMDACCLGSSHENSAASLRQQGVKWEDRFIIMTGGDDQPGHYYPQNQHHRPTPSPVDAPSTAASTTSRPSSSHDDDDRTPPSQPPARVAAAPAASVGGATAHRKAPLFVALCGLAGILVGSIHNSGGGGGGGGSGGGGVRPQSQQLANAGGRRGGGGGGLLWQGEAGNKRRIDSSVGGGGGWSGLVEGQGASGGNRRQPQLEVAADGEGNDEPTSSVRLPPFPPHGRQQSQRAFC